MKIEEQHFHYNKALIIMDDLLVQLHKVIEDTNNRGVQLSNAKAKANEIQWYGNKISDEIKILFNILKEEE